MSRIIAVAGKGGTGKSTLAGMLVQAAVEAGRGTVLAIDADPSMSLSYLLGIRDPCTVAGIRDRVRDGIIPGGLSRPRYLEQQLEQCLAEFKGFDALTMGKPEGPGCYCAVNNMLKNFMKKITGRYCYTIIDNEAGMEHLNRYTGTHIDHLIVTSGPAASSAMVAEQIMKSIKSMPGGVKSYGALIIDTFAGAAKDGWNAAEELLKNCGAELWGRIPFEDKIFNLSQNAKPLNTLNGSSDAYRFVKELFLTYLDRRGADAAGN